jgi:ATP-dependent Clp protease adaptor protein ClpS
MRLRAAASLPWHHGLAWRPDLLWQHDGGAIAGSPGELDAIPGMPAAQGWPIPAGDFYTDTMVKTALISMPDRHSLPVARLQRPGAPVRAMADDDNRSGQGGPSATVITKVKPKAKRPNLYRVLILNDDYTPMEFVVHVLEKFFQKDVEAATQIMLHVHHHGIGECGVYTYEIAETKVTQVMDFARKHQHPLQCVMEKK